jgi:hypothetical protein
MTCAELIEQVEVAGGVLALNGERIRIRLPEDAAHLLDELRTRKNEVLLLLRRRAQIPAMPPGVRLAHWEPKPAPVVLTQYSVVTDVDRFIRMTLLELKAALAGKRWQAGHRSVRDLIDRLEECGVRVEIESEGLDICQSKTGGSQ